MLSSFLAVNFRLASRSSLALLNASNFTVSVHKHTLLSQNALTRSFIASAHVPFASEQAKSEPEEDSSKTEKKTRKRGTSKGKKASASEKEQKLKVAKKPKSKPELEKGETLPVPAFG
jgi:hypothetical protein